MRRFPIFLLALLTYACAPVSQQFLDASVTGIQGSEVTRIDTFRAQGGSVAWSPDGRSIAYSAKNAQGYYEVHLADPDGSHDRVLTQHTPNLPKKHVSVVSWHASGKYLLLLVEKPEHPGTSFEATPGFAGYTDMWIVTSDGSRAYPLTNLPNDADHGVLIPAFSADGNRIVWSERIARPDLFNHAAGLLAIKVADVAMAAQGPTLTNIRTYQPEGKAFYETYGFSPDGSRIIFCSNMRGHSFWDEDIYTMELATGAITRLTQGNYNEHAVYSRDGRHIIWMTNRDISLGGGTDWWVMRADGSNKRRLTFFNDSTSPHYAGGAVWAGLGSFNPGDTKFIGGVQTSLVTQEATIKILSLKFKD